MKPILLIVAMATFLSHSSLAQQYIIKHDLQADQSQFYVTTKNKDTVAVKSIRMKQPGRISLQVSNFNPFYWNAKVTAFKKPVEEETSQVGTFISSLIKGSGSTNFVSLGINKGLPLEPAVEKKIKELQLQSVKFTELSEKLTALQYDPKLPAVQIKDGAQTAMKEVFGKDSISQQEIRQMGQELDQAKKYVNSEAGETVVRYAFNDNLAAIFNTYRSIMLTDFSFQYTVNGQTDFSELRLSVYPRNTKDSTVTDTIVRYFPIQTGPVLKLRNSIGISFNYFADKNRSYYINPDTTIGQGSGDLFTPVLSTFIHFYTSNKNGLRWGGTFGFGVPLLGEKKDIHFMLGLCTLLGKNEPVIISAGISGAKVDRLTNGWKTGQKVPELNFSIPVLSQFRAGVFFSVTFNLNNLTGNRGTE